MKLKTFILNLLTLESSQPLMKSWKEKQTVLKISLASSAVSLEVTMMINCIYKWNPSHLASTRIPSGIFSNLKNQPLTIENSATH